MLQGAGLAGYGFLVPLGIGYMLALSYAFSFSELALMFPRAGTLSTYTEVAIGHFPAILAVFAGYVVVAMFALSAELVLIDLVLAELFPGLLPPMVSALAIIAFFTAMNIRGVDVFAKLQSALAFIMVLALLAVSLMAIFAAGVPRMPSPNLLAESNPMGWGVLALTALAIWGFVGAEFVCPLVEETKEPERNTPRSMIGHYNYLGGLRALLRRSVGAYSSRSAGRLATSSLNLFQSGAWRRGTYPSGNRSIHRNLQHGQYLARRGSKDDLRNGQEWADLRGFGCPSSNLQNSMGSNSFRSDRDRGSDAIPQ